MPSPASSAAPTAPLSEHALKVLLWLVAMGFFMQSLDATIVNTALPSMAVSLGESPLRMHSVVICYSLTMAVMIPVSGWLADKFGTRNVFVGAVAVFAAASLLCANAPTLNLLAASRVLQGMGGAMLLPVGRLAILRIVPHERYLSAMSFIAIPGLVGPLLGPTLGGWLVKVASWHWIFLINVPVGLIGCVVAFLAMPDARNPDAGRFDIRGYLMLTLAMVLLSLALDGLSDLGMEHAVVLLMLVFSMACLIAYCLYATRAPQPLFSLDLFRIHTFSVGLLGNLFARIGSGAMPYLIPLLLQLCLGFSAFHAGMMMLPTAATAMLSKRLITRLILRFGYRRVLLVNTVMVGMMMASFSLTQASQPLWLLILQLALFGGFNSMQFTAMNTLTLKDLGSRGASSGNSLFSLTQMLAMSLGVTVAASLLATFAHFLHQNDNPDALPIFHATFLCVGLITAASAWIFAQLSPEIREGNTERAQSHEQT